MKAAPRAATGASPGLQTAPTTRPDELTAGEQELLTRFLPGYRVVLHNDDKNSMDHVVSALVKSVPSLEAEEAVRIMLEAHNNGKATVVVVPKETAELYAQRIQTFGLTATIEPA
ncbi:MAG: ATP-dependent Clp protease adaptor ClpS [Chloroflexota bacterium]